MKKLALVLTFVIGFSLSSCAAGPHQLQRSVDDWDAKLYTENMWLDVVLNVVPVIPLARIVGGLGDFLVTDGYTFWAKDAWDGKGTGFKHKEFIGSDGHMESLLIEKSKWMEVK